MDFAKFKESLDKSRALEVELDAAKFRMRLPTEHAWRVAYEDHKGRGPAHTRAVLVGALVGWEGVCQRHFAVDAGDEPVPFSEDAKVTLLDERQDLADDLMVHLMAKVADRRTAMEAARKNSSREPSGT